MKKLFALLALVLGVVSCQTEPEGFDVVVGGEQEVMLNVSLPEATRATSAEGFDFTNFASNTQFDLRFILEIRYDNGNETKVVREVKTSETTSATFPVRLAPNRNYTFTVWADLVKQGTVGYTPEDLFYNTTSLANITLNDVDEDFANNVELRDAYTYTDTFEFSGENREKLNMTLTRPFAKVRVVATDLEKVTAFGINPAKGEVVYGEVYSAFNAVDGNVTGSAISKEVNYNVIANNYTEQNGQLTVFADYIFVPTTANTQPTITFTLDVQEANGTSIKKNAFSTPIPVSRNKVTSIVGNVLTQGDDIKVEIKDNGAFDGNITKYIGEVKETIVLSDNHKYIFEDLTVITTSENAVVVEENANVALDIIGEVKLQSAGKAIYVPSTSTLTINGLSATRSAKNGKLEVVGGNGVNSDTNGSAIAVDGKLFINDVASLTAKGYGKCGYGIGGIEGEVTIENTTIDYVSGGYVQPLFVNDTKYGKSEPEGAAAIGGKKVVISNSVITKAEGGSKAAAIGNRYWESAEVTITNSTLGDIFGGNASAAIGGSRYSSDKTAHHTVKVTIENSIIDNAVGGQYGAGIGSGYDTHCQAGGEGSTAVNEITITNSTITAQGGQYAAGIGTGFHVAALAGSIDAASTINATAGERFYKGTYTYAQHIGYGVVDPDREYCNEVVEFMVAGEVIEEPAIYTGVTMVKDLEEFKTALENVVSGNNLIIFANDIVGDAIVYQVENANVIVDGNSKKYNGTISIEGNNRGTGAETLLVKNVNFETEYNDEKVSKYFILGLTDGNSYPHNITIEGCSFTNTTGVEGNNYTVAGMNFNQFYNLKVVNCESTNLHSLLQAQSCDNTVVVDGVTINGKNGVSFGNTMNATIENSTINAIGYGVRADATDAREVSLTVKDCNIKAYIPVVARKLNDTNVKAFHLTVEGTPAEFIAMNDAKHQIALGSNEYEEGKELVAPVSEYTLNVTEGYIVYTAQPVAKVGNTEYTSIDVAVDNWTNGSTLTLLSDVTLNSVITLKSTEYHILDLGTYTLTAAKGKDAISITAEGRTSASYALDIKADATNPGGITATSKAVVKTTGKSGVQDRPIIRFYNGVYNASNVISHSGSNGTKCPQFQFHGGVYNANVSANRALIQIYGGTFNGKFYTSVDSSAYMLISGGKFKDLNNLYGSALNSDKFTIGSSKGNFDRGVYVDDEGYFVVGGAVITEFGDMFAAKATNASKAGSYLPYSSAAEHGLYYTNAAAAIATHGEANVVLK